MTPYEQGFVEKLAQAGVTSEEAQALKDFLKEHREEKAKRESQKKNMREKNREDRVFNSKLAFTALLGLLGAQGGGHLGGYLGGNPGALAGIVAGGLGGGALGNWIGGRVGNAKADAMEEEEDRTGVSVFDQNHRDMTRQLNNWYMWDRGDGGRSLLYSLATR